MYDWNSCPRTETLSAYRARGCRGDAKPPAFFNANFSDTPDNSDNSDPAPPGCAVASNAQTMERGEGQGNGFPHRSNGRSVFSPTPSEASEASGRNIKKKNPRTEKQYGDLPEIQPSLPQKTRSNGNAVKNYFLALAFSFFCRIPASRSLLISCSMEL